MNLKKLFSQTTIFMLLLSSFSVQAQDDTIRVMEYNLLQLSSSGSSLNRVDDHLKHIVNYVKPDILLVNEVTNPTAVNYILSNALNVNGVNYYKKGNFNDASSLNNAMYYNSDKLAFESQDVIAASPRPADGFHFYYNDPLLASHQDTVFLSAYATHLKAGSSSSNASQRENAAIAIRDYLDAKPEVTNHFLVGDLNLYNSSEGAYQELLSGGQSQFSDPINTPGLWHSTSAYASIHTQSTNTSVSGGAGGGMDDRFDFILTTNDILQGAQRVEYVAGSYDAIGNDGNRFNKSLNTYPSNTQYPDTLVDHLFGMSDHLPVVADFAIDLPESPTAGVGPCEDLYFSEYVEGTALNRALELYNPTASAQSLSDYELHFYPDGTDNLPSYRKVSLSGTVGAQSAFVITAPGAGSAVANKSDLAISQLDSLLTGNDAVLLFNAQSGDTLDIFGNIGQNPGSSGWNVDSGSTENNTLVREDYVNQGELTWGRSKEQWVTYARDFTDSLGSHYMYPCGTPTQCPELFVSEYLEGSDQNRAVEIYNPSSKPVILDGDYAIRVYIDGSSSFYETILEGVIYPDQSFVLANSYSTLSGITNNADQTESFSEFAISLATGNDAVALFKGTDTLDMIGVIGEDPGSSWPVFGTNGVNGSTKDYTLVRDSSIQSGETNWSVGKSQWQVYSQDEDSYMGAHYMTPCPAVMTKKDSVSRELSFSETTKSQKRLNIYPNPSDGKFHLEVFPQSSGAITVSVINSTGKLVHKSNYRYKNSEAFKKKVHLSDLTSGAYFVKVQTPSRLLTSPVLIQE